MSVRTYPNSLPWPVHQGGAGDRSLGGRGRPRLLQQRADPGVSGGGHHSHAAQAANLGQQGQGPVVKQDFRYEASEDVYVCPAGEKLTYHYTNQEDGRVLRRYWTSACQTCAIKDRCTSGKERRITRWQHGHVVEAVQRRLDAHPEKMRQRRETASIPSARSRPGWARPTS